MSCRGALKRSSSTPRSLVHGIVFDKGTPLRRLIKKPFRTSEPFFDDDDFQTDFDHDFDGDGDDDGFRRIMTMMLVVISMMLISILILTVRGAPKPARRSNHQSQTPTPQPCQPLGSTPRTRIVTILRPSPPCRGACLLVFLSTHVQSFLTLFAAAGTGPGAAATCCWLFR